MTDINNNDAVHESHLDEIEISNESHIAAKQTILDKLNSNKDEGLREIAINELKDNDLFWDCIFSIGANLVLDRDKLIVDAINVGVHAFTSVAEEVYDLSLKMEKEELS